MSNTLTFSDKWRLWRGKYFPERQLFLRSEGRVRFLTISTNVQLFMSSCAIGFLGWGIVTSYAYLTHDLLLEEKNAKISSISADYQNLSNDFSALELEVEKRAKQLEDRQAFLEEFVGTSPEQTSNSTEVDAEEQTPDPEEVPQTSFFHELLNSESTEVATVSTTERRMMLLNRLKESEIRQRQLANTMLAQVNQRLDTLNSALAPTELTSADLIRQWQGDETAMGGPYEPEAGFQPVFAANDHSEFVTLLDARQRLEIATKVLDSFPIGKPAEKYYVSSRFGRRRDPLKKTWANHPGLDLAGWPGTAIYATAPGEVVHSGWYGPYGKMVEIDHGNGFKTRYGHMRKLRVKKGEIISTGTRVGDMGKTGRVTGTHLHYEIWFEDSVRDPMPFLKAANDVLKIQGRHEETIE
ncbi:MAG: peptidoglycan DD-metalloendopeptidase family protein [Kordiimonas sp.]